MRRRGRWVKVAANRKGPSPVACRGAYRRGACRQGPGRRGTCRLLARAAIWACEGRLDPVMRPALPEARARVKGAKLSADGDAQRPPVRARAVGPGRAGGDRKRGRVGREDPRQRRSLRRLGALSERARRDLTGRAKPSTCSVSPEGKAMGSDPEDRDDEAALRARLDRLSADLKGRAAPPSAPKPKSTAQNGRRRGVGDVARLAGRQRVRLRGHPRLRDWVGSRPRARHQSGLPDRIFPAWRGGRGVERDPADFAERRVIE